MLIQKKVQRYYVTVRVIAEQSLYVEATSKKEAMEKAKDYSEIDPIDFNVIRWLPSTMRAFEDVDLSRCQIEDDMEHNWLW